EPAGVARHEAPVSTGVPLPRGTVRDPARVWVATPGGTATRSQATVLERWPDGTIRWLLVDFLADARANGETTYTLRQGTPSRPAPGPRVRLESRADARVIDAGALRVAVPTDGSAIARSVDVGGRRVLGTIPLPDVDASGGVRAGFTAQPAVIETQGPVRTELLLRGAPGGGAPYGGRVGRVAGPAPARAAP